ncbi:hypothetical protein EI427_09320 [Flammeovirga pectinis]|uniref:Bacterial surface antigen (D15) domain-containing protein n=1 Tax=Flammeovirga pectinis TaxID=2494373 RepID=A0A3S9P2K6_9BACT|nr:BamA/TamA family outer membrane protein [Flammeovirga pectinis]AZQ62429.1 hypothetical protein EI427_09320 [Flammeovirga pectinis]
MKFFITFFIGFLLYNNQTSFAQISMGGGSGSGTRTDKKVSFMPIPYINYDRSLGFSIGALPMAMYNLSKTDTISPSSITGVLGMYTTNESWFTMTFTRLYFNEDKYRATFAAGLGDINFQTYVNTPIGGNFINYNTGVNFIKVELQRRVLKNTYFGLNYMYTDFENTFDIVDNDTSSVTTLQTIGAIISYDNRDNVYYPYKGEIGNINLGVSPESLGNASSNTKVEIDFNKYFAIGKRDVIATRAYVGFGIGDLTFNQQFIVGQSDIRGYTQGKYRGNAMYNIQAEYRWNFHKKMAINGFAGIATVSGANETELDGTFLPGVGVGYRYTVFPKNHMNVGLDGAIGRDDWGVYFRIGEAF